MAFDKHSFVLNRPPLPGNRHSRWFAVTDDARQDSAALIAALPPSVACILRDYAHPDRTAHLARLLRLARRRHMGCLIAGDPALAWRLKADGTHLPEYLVRRPSLRHRLLAGRPFTAAAHSVPAALRAYRLGADAIMLSPLFPTDSGPHKKPLGRWRFLRFCQLLPPACRRRVIALGGVTMRNFTRCRPLPIGGIAGLSLYKGLTAVANPPQRF